MYKCVIRDEILAVKIVKMEPQYTETQEVRLVIAMYMKDVGLLSACPVPSVFK